MHAHRPAHIQARSKHLTGAELSTLEVEEIANDTLSKSYGKKRGDGSARSRDSRLNKIVKMAAKGGVSGLAVSPVSPATAAGTPPAAAALPEAVTSPFPTVGGFPAAISPDDLNALNA